MSDLVDKIWSAIQRPSPSVTREEIAALVLEDGNAKVKQITDVIDQMAQMVSDQAAYQTAPSHKEVYARVRTEWQRPERWNTCLTRAALDDNLATLPEGWTYDVFTDCYHPKGHVCKFCGHDKRKD